ncbi:NAD(P)/FAD-dependent oxidoreductase [Pseudonocardia endophytica]|uniref:Glycine/D-amino acid oxidase-like deaminating enzyme n=1 Tax=Pseudonocardia endophytica TaxID=401976 RepID=A0A4R1HZX3_PSEEN|nr:FAD-binding oxidoreductase [Pseudonocardia endophytica]TCK26795.1 glycine/D-amino acid oxidase-like deaminating enzyme [Pseudonocardia endophytica]
MLPDKVRYVVVGAGIHGLATARALAHGLSDAGQGDGTDVLVVDKTAIGAGASGVACGVIRNNYFQPAMRRLMAHSVQAWERDAEALSYHGVGYIQAAPDAMADDVRQIAREQNEIGYESVLVEGVDACNAYMREIFADWQAPGISILLHEKRGGYANNTLSLAGLAGMVREAGVRIETGVSVTGFERDGGRVGAVVTDQGTVACDAVVVAVGPWVRDIWSMLGLPETITVQDGGVDHPDRPMWTYWALQEGTLEVDPEEFTDNRGGFPPVVHVDSDAPLHDDTDGSLVTDAMWGIYYKPDFHFGGVQGGASPERIDRPAGTVAVDPYGPASPEFTVDDSFVRMWTSALAACHKRFERKRGLYSTEPSGGIGAFTPDSFPVFDTFRGNAYVIADSNHGYKMLGVGELVARELLGEHQPLLEPFRFDRYRTGDLHPTSHSPFPWS